MSHTAMSHTRTNSGTKQVPLFGDPGQPLHPLDRGTLRPLLGRLSRNIPAWEGGGRLRSIELVGRYLTGDWEPHEPKARRRAFEEVRVSQGVWTRLIGRVGGLALYAVSALTPDVYREQLLGLLRMWAESPFAEGAARLRWGVARTEQDCARDEHGATLAVGRLPHGRRRFVELRTGETDPPRLGPVEELTEPPRGWGTPDQLRRLVDCACEHGPVTWDPEAVTVLVERTGVGYATAKLLLAGLPDTENDVRTFLDAQQRSRLGLSTAQLNDSQLELRELSISERLDLLADVLPEDPTVLWESHGMRLLAERIADAWCARHRRRPAVSPTTWAEFVGVSRCLSAAELCATLAAPHDSTLLTEDVDSRLKKRRYADVALAREDGQWALEKFLDCVPQTVELAYHRLPAGDLVRDGVPTAIALLHERLSNPLLLLDAGSPLNRRLDSLEGLRELFGNEPSPFAHQLDVDTVDDGLTIAVPGRYSTSLFFRPARYGDDERSRLLRRTAVSRTTTLLLQSLEWLRGEECAQLVARMRPGTLPTGAYEANPQASVPDLVTTVADHLHLPTDAAAYYLQLLALPQPTDRDVRQWNGWKPAQLRKAATTLLEAGLVVTDRRTRAGRKVFLPGPWATGARKYVTAMEVWKAELLGCTLSPDRSQVTTPPPLNQTLPTLFTTAWQRVTSGDGPR